MIIASLYRRPSIESVFESWYSLVFAAMLKITAIITITPCERCPVPHSGKDSQQTLSGGIDRVFVLVENLDFDFRSIDAEPCELRPEVVLGGFEGLGFGIDPPRHR